MLLLGSHYYHANVEFLLSASYANCRLPLACHLELCPSTTTIANMRRAWGVYTVPVDLCSKNIFDLLFIHNIFEQNNLAWEELFLICEWYDRRSFVKLGEVWLGLARHAPLLQPWGLLSAEYTVQSWSCAASQSSWPYLHRWGIQILSQP